MKIEHLERLAEKAPTGKWVVWGVTLPGISIGTDPFCAMICRCNEPHTDERAEQVRAAFDYIAAMHNEGLPMLQEQAETIKAKDEEIERWRNLQSKEFADQSQAVKDMCASYGLEPGYLQSEWRDGKRDDPRELEDAIIDALWMGCIPAHRGDGVGCASQIVEYWLKKAKKLEADNKALRKVLGLYDALAEDFKDTKLPAAFGCRFLEVGIKAYALSRSQSPDNFRGHSIHVVDGRWFYTDTGEAVEGSHRSCAVCGDPDTSEGHDPCLGSLPGVKNACCGHGGEGYISFDNGVVVRGLFCIEHDAGDQS